ncbi:MAG: response regulator [Roseburia sp.]|nr:response regulator [Roseburia sp.]
MKEYLKRKWCSILYFLFLGITIIFLICAGSSGEDYRYIQYDEIPFGEPWDYLFSDGTAGETELPAQLEAGEAESLILTNVLPEIPEGTVFIYRSRHTSVKIYVGGELRYDQGLHSGDGSAVEDTIFPLPGNVWNEVMLLEEDSGKEIRIESTGIVQSYLEGPGSIYLGDRGSFFLKLIWERKGTILGAFLLLLVAYILLVLWLILTITTRSHYQNCLCLALFSASVAFWEFTETRCLQFFFPNMRMMGLLAYEILALAPVPIALFYSYGKRKRTVFLSRIAAGLALAVWVVNNLLHFLHIVDISETLIVTQTLNIIEILFIGYIQVSDIIGDARAEKDSIERRFWWIPLLGLGIFVPLVLIELFRYVFRIGQFQDDAILTNLGMIVYIISLAFSSVMKLVSDNMRISAANESKTLFLANMSHEIRTPLNAVLGFDEMILRETTDEKILEYAENIQSAGASLRDIINSILDLTKIESGKMEMTEGEYSVVQLLDNVSSMVSALAEKKGLAFELQVDEQLPEWLWGDEIHIRQVLVNLMTNAVKYTPEGSVTFKVQMVRNADEEGYCKILFSVKDTGIGIREEDRERLFEKFERLDHAKNRNVEGTGLGMSIVVGLLEAMHSKIELKSVYGEGSEFYFVLKQKIVSADTIGTYKLGAARAVPENDRETYIAPEARILIVDDVALNLQVACGLLKGLQMQIDTAESGAEAIDLVQDNRYDVILMDHMMPGMDGIEASKRIRELAELTGDSYYTEVPILALTANALSGMKEKFLEEGLQDFIGKPVEGKELERVLHKWLPKEKIMAKGQTETRNTEEEWDIHISGLDVAAARIYAPEKGMYVNMLRSYLTAIPGTRAKIEQFVEEEDKENYTITVHGLKSASKLIGATEISELARQLEETANAGNYNEAWEQTPKLLALYGDCETALGVYFSGEKQEKSMTLPEQEMRTLLAGLKEAAEEFDMEAFLDWEKRMENVEVEAPYEEAWQGIKLAVQNLAFSEVIEKIEEL